MIIFHGDPRPPISKAPLPHDLYAYGGRYRHVGRQADRHFKKHITIRKRQAEIHVYDCAAQCSAAFLTLRATEENNYYS